MSLKKIALTTLAASFLTACASNQPAEVEQAAAKIKLPDWVTMPIIEDGFADTQCVQTTADMNILKNKATALARAEIAKQINIQVKAMDKTYQNLTDTADGSSSGSTFESVSKQVTNQKLAGSRATKLDYVDFPDGTQKMCVMVTMSPATTAALYKEIVKESTRQLSPQHESVLFQEFKAYKAQQELDSEIDKNNG